MWIYSKCFTFIISEPFKSIDFQLLIYDFQVFTDKQTYKTTPKPKKMEASTHPQARIPYIYFAPIFQSRFSGSDMNCYKANILPAILSIQQSYSTFRTISKPIVANLPQNTLQNTPKILSNALSRFILTTIPFKAGELLYRKSGNIKISL